MPKVKKTRNDYVPQGSAPCCHVAGCKEPGEYKAPTSKNSLGEYAWYCLDHIREYNQKWDYFKDMDRDEIEAFIKDATTGHRPTWSREGRIRHNNPQALHDALYEFLHMGLKPVRKPHPSLPVKLRKALALMDMDYPYTQRDLKSHYRALVKKHHPDVNKGNKLEEEKFKQITAAHLLLSEHLKKT